MPIKNIGKVRKTISTYFRYRPDIGYATSMIYVADILAENLSSDYEVFQNFANLVHGTHLINFYTNNNIIEFQQNYVTNALKR